jgi:hypothetical protein
MAQVARSGVRNFLNVNKHGLSILKRLCFQGVDMLQLDEKGLVAGRSCGSCTLCCKVFDVSWLEKPKPAGAWCHHCAPGKGCSIWQDRPSRCMDYHCLWRLNPNMGEEWRPDKAGFIMSEESATLPFSVTVDPTKPNSWRREPYYSGLKTAARAAIAKKRAIVIVVGARQWVMLPDGDVPVPQGLENTDFSLSQAADGRWQVAFQTL